MKKGLINRCPCPCPLTATNFSKLFAELETTQASILNGVAANKTLLTGVQEAFAQNLENVNKEVKKLEERMTKLQQMIK